MIPYFNIEPTDREREFLLDAFDSSWWSSGKYVYSLENKLTSYFNTDCITTSNGTTALMLSYFGLGLKPGDEIIVPGFGFMAAANVAVVLGLKPVFVDVRPDTWCINADLIEESLSNKTKAIVLIHTYGVMCDVQKIKSLVRKHNITVIEDCAESFGAYNEHGLAGTFGDVGTLSLQATKTLTTGEGGAILSDNKNLLDKMRIIREHGLVERGTYNHIDYGVNFRLPNILAAIGVAQLDTIDSRIQRRIDIAEYYKNNINAIAQECPEGTANWVFAFRTSNRDALIEMLLEHGIQTRPGFTSPNFLDIYPNSYLPISDMLSKEVISLPTYPELNHWEIDYICQTVNELL